MGLFKKKEEIKETCDCIFCGQKITSDSVVYARSTADVEEDKVLDNFTSGFKDYNCGHPLRHIAYDENNREFKVVSKDGKWPLIVRSAQNDTMADLCLCPHCHCGLPKGFYKYKRIYIGMLGGKRSGKTSYIVTACKNLENRLHNMGGLNLARVTIAPDSDVYLEYMYKQSMGDAGMPPTDVNEKPVFPIVLLVEPYNDRYEPFFIVMQDIPGELMAEKYRTQLMESNITKSDAFIAIADANMFAQTPEKQEYSSTRSKRLELEQQLKEAKGARKFKDVKKSIILKKQELEILENRKTALQLGATQDGPEDPELLTIEEQIQAKTTEIKRLTEELDSLPRASDTDVSEEALADMEEDVRYLQRKENRLRSDINTDNFRDNFINMEDFSAVLENNVSAIILTVSKLDRWMKTMTDEEAENWSFCKDHSDKHKDAIDQSVLDQSDADIESYFEKNALLMNGMLDILVDQLTNKTKQIENDENSSESTVLRSHVAVSSRNLSAESRAMITDDQFYQLSINTMDPILQICAWRNLLPVKQDVEQVRTRWFFSRG